MYHDARLPDARSTKLSVGIRNVTNGLRHQRAYGRVGEGFCRWAPIAVYSQSRNLAGCMRKLCRAPFSDRTLPPPRLLLVMIAVQTLLMLECFEDMLSGRLPVVPPSSSSGSPAPLGGSRGGSMAYRVPPNEFLKVLVEGSTTRLGGLHAVLQVCFLPIRSN